MVQGLSTKHRGDIAEFRVITELLSIGLNVLKPVGDRLPYDLAVDKDGTLVRIQVKLAWALPSGNYVVDIRRSQTNRRCYKHTKYQHQDFEFLIAWIQDLDKFYIFPSSFACSFGGSITMLGLQSKQRDMRSSQYLNRWDLLRSTVQTF